MRRPGLIVGLVALLSAMAGGAMAEDRPGEFDYYTLSLSWSPTYCATRREDYRRNEPQCSGDRHYAFVVHGLWPQYKKGWPANCETGERPWVPEAVIQRMLDIMPSKRLIIHQYRKHGVCSGLSPDAYFRLSRKAYEAIKIPAKFRDLSERLEVTPDEVERAFLRANPALKPEMINVDCKNRRLRELRICFTRELKLRDCGFNERQDRLCSAGRIVMPPIRAGAASFGEDDDEDYEGYEEGEDDARYD